MIHHRSAIEAAMKLDIRTPDSATLGNRRTINAARVFRWDTHFRVGQFHHFCHRSADVHGDPGAARGSTHGGKLC
jgi:hypothetical protein